MTGRTPPPTALAAAWTAGLVTALALLGTGGIAGAFPFIVANPSFGARGPVEPVHFQFLGRSGSRVEVRTVVAVPLEKAQRNAHGFFNLRLTGEVLVDGRQYDHFGYHFDVPRDESSDEPLTLAFERFLRPGEFRLVVQVEDLQSGRVLRAERQLTVPRLDQGADPGTGNGASGPRDQALTGRPEIRILPPPSVARGYQTFVAVTQGKGIDRVSFVLDGHTVLTRNRPPFEARLDLGNRPRVRTLQVEALGADGQVVARDEVQLNTVGERFAVELEEPGASDREGELLWVRARVEAPAARRVERVELYLDQDRVAVWHQPPWQGQIPVPSADPLPLRAVAVLDEGARAEDAILLNARGHDAIRVDLMELSTAVVDHRGRAVDDLGSGAFRVLEDGVEQRIERFERIRDASIHVGLVIDTSGSMEPIMEPVRSAAQAFFEDLLGPGDRATLVTFANAPRVRVPFTDDLPLLANGLELLEAGGATALYDSLIHTLTELQGIRGQRVLVLLSDGIDNRSRHTAEDVLELARRSAVTIYTVGIEGRLGLADLDRGTLQRLAGESGGRSFFVRGDRQSLARVYGEIEKDVRSRYMLSYYSSNTSSGRDFRLVEVEISRPHLEARTIRGYYP